MQLQRKKHEKERNLEKKTEERKKEQKILMKEKEECKRRTQEIAHDQDFPIRKYDKVLFHPKNAIPVDLESDNVLFVVDIDDVVAVFRRATDSLVNEESVDLSEDTDGDDLDV